MEPEAIKIIQVLRSWVAAGMDADEIVKRMGLANGPVASAARGWVGRRGGAGSGSYDPDAPRLPANPAPPFVTEEQASEELAEILGWEDDEG